MISKSLIKLIDEAILPAVILIVVKLLGLIASSHLFNFQFTIKNGDFLKILPSIQFANPLDYLKAENYSNLLMFTVTALGTAYVLVRAHFFHESHITPKLQAKLISFNLEWLIAPTYHLYHQATIWLIFLWLTVGFLTLSSVLGTTFPQIAIVAFIIAANFSWMFVMDIEKEIEISRGTA